MPFQVSTLRETDAKELYYHFGSDPRQHWIEEVHYTQGLRAYVCRRLGLPAPALCCFDVL